MTFKDKVVVITGGAQGIGRCIADEFAKEGAKVAVIDKQSRPDDFDLELYYQGDLAEKLVLENFADSVLRKLVLLQAKTSALTEECPNR